jgi:hypothetical protein
MQAILDHLSRVVRPALKEHIGAEAELTAAHRAGELANIEAAQHRVIRTARIAAIELHQFGDVVWKEPCPSLPPFADLAEVRSAVSSRCRFLRTAGTVDDVRLLMDVADAFKHHKPDRRSISVASANAVVALASGWGELRFGEGKYGGTEQMIVTRTDGAKRALSSVLQNVFYAWTDLLDQAQLPIGEY